MEIWKEVAAQYGPYEVSNQGNIRRADSFKLKKATVAKVGYFVVNLWLRNKSNVVYVHSLVAEAFIGQRPPGYTVNHIDGNKLNNNAGNLEYLTNADNVRHAHMTGLCPKGEKCSAAKLTENQAAEIKRRALGGERTRDLAAEFGVGMPIVSQIKHGTRWKHLDVADSAAPCHAAPLRTKAEANLAS